MNKDEILKKAQTEGREKDLPDLEAQKSGAWAAYIIGVLLLIAVDTVNGLCAALCEPRSGLCAVFHGFCCFPDKIH